MSHECTETTRLSAMEKDLASIKTDIAVLRRDLEHVMGRICQHIEDAEKTGGWRDRMNTAERDIRELTLSLSTFRKFQLLYSAIGGIVGGIVGSKSPELLIGLFKHLS